MQQLGMAGGRFEVALLPQDEPQAFGLEAVELRVAGHAGSTPRALAKVASGGELSRLALAIAVTTAQAAGGGGAPTLIFDEIDAGVGGTVADSVGRLMKQLGHSLGDPGAGRHAPGPGGRLRRPPLRGGQGPARPPDAFSAVQPVAGEARVAEIARMLGGEHQLSGCTAHAPGPLGLKAGSARRE
jgi:DNA repair protein RecN (Recombination protein N)